LLPRSHDVTQSQITIDGLDIWGMTLQSLRMQIGIVQQDVFPFLARCAKTSLIGDLSANEEAIREAARRAHLGDFIDA